MESLPLFKDLEIDAPSTEGIKYAGSKLKLLPYILQLANEVEASTIFDGFAGSTRVSQAFAKRGYTVLSNDIAVWSKVFNTCYLLNNKNAHHYAELISHLNNLPPVHGWFSEHYGGVADGNSAIQVDGMKKPWQLHNTTKLDAIRLEIEKLNLTEIEKSVVLSSLMLALDQVDNTLGHYVSYLKEWSQRSYNTMKLKIPNLIPSTKKHQVFHRDIFEIVGNVKSDLAYYDPPYGSNNEKMPPSRVRYASYYHVWTSICLFDKPVLFGKCNRRLDTSDKTAVSVFEEFKQNKDEKFIAVEAINKLLQMTNARWIILSYSSGGRATAEELQDSISANGKLRKIVEVDYKKNVMSDMKWTNEWVRDVELPNREFLFLMEKC